MLEKLLRRLEKRRERHEARREMKEFLSGRAMSKALVAAGVRE
jgi:hypothetical protein